MRSHIGLPEFAALQSCDGHRGEQDMSQVETMGFLPSGEDQSQWPVGVSAADDDAPVVIDLR
jgi:hypothetical protein